jgi:PPOX class probable F420-dependent enzyme
MKRMTKAEYKRFLLEGTKTGNIATVKKDVSPHVVPIWFYLDGDDLLFTTGEQSIKAKNMKRDPRVCVSVDDQTPPYAFVQIEGIATFSDNLNEMLYWATRIGGRYMGERNAVAFGKRNAVPGELLVRIRPTKVVAYKDVASW